MTLNVGVYLYPGVELLDFAGPCEVFTTANRLAPEGAPFSVFSVAAQRRPATSRAGVVIQPDYSFADHPPIDVVLVPGGVVDKVMNEAAVVGWIAEVSAAARLTASVCNGAFLLAAAARRASDAAAAAAVEQMVPAIRQQQAEHAAELGGALFPVAEQRQHTGWADGVPGVAAVNAGEAAQCGDEKSQIGRAHV